MILSEWKAVWDMAATVFSREPIQLRVAIGLGLAFTTLMVIEGIRASFFPARQRIPESALPAAPAPVRPMAAAPPVLAEPKAAPQAMTAAPAAAQAVMMRSKARLGTKPAINRKRDTARPRAYRPMRPKIQASRLK